MNGTISKIEKNKTIIIAEDDSIITVNTLFLPIRLREGDTVELEDGRILMH